MKRGELLRQLEANVLGDALGPVYGREAGAARERLRELVEEFAGAFPAAATRNCCFFPPRAGTELGGNHTDHQRGRALAASVNLDTIACVAPNGRAG